MKTFPRVKQLVQLVKIANITAAFAARLYSCCMSCCLTLTRTAANECLAQLHT